MIAPILDASGVQDGLLTCWMKSRLEELLLEQSLLFAAPLFAVLAETRPWRAIAAGAIAIPGPKAFGACAGARRGRVCCTWVCACPPTMAPVYLLASYILSIDFRYVLHTSDHTCRLIPSQVDGDSGLPLGRPKPWHLAIMD